MKVGERLLQLRQKKGYTMKELSKITGISDSHISDLEKGKSNPSIDKLKILCEAFGVTLAEFFSDGEDDKKELSTALVEAVEELSQVELDLEKLSISSLIVKRLLDEGLLDEEGNLDQEGQEAIKQALKIDNMFKKKG